MKAMMTPYKAPQEKGKISWAQCKDAAGVWHFDTKASTYTPDPVKRKSTLKLHLVGSETHDLHVDHYEIDVALNGKHLTTMTKPGGDYHNTWSYDMSQDIPFFAPPGTYAVSVKAMGNLKMPHGGWRFAASEVVGCANAQLTL